MYHTTGFTKDQIVELCALISAVNVGEMAVVWPPVLGQGVGKVVRWGGGGVCDTPVRGG
jgi:hypothetical protein